MEKNPSKKRLDILIDTLSQYWLISDPNAIKILLAGVVAHYFESDPLWIFLIAPPSSLKTELISALDNSNDVYQLSSLTSQTLFSGLRKMKGQEKSNSVLEKIGDKILTLKDFSTVLSMRYEDRAIVLGQLREVYDGHYHARYGNGVEVNWQGRIGLIAGVTPIIDTHYRVFQTLGERFVQYRLEAVEEDALSRLAIKSLGKEKGTRQKAREVMERFFTSLIPNIPPIKEIQVPEAVVGYLSQLAAFCVRARSGVVRDGYDKTLEYIPEPEAPARLVKQLATLCCALAVLEGRKMVMASDYFLALKVGLDSIPRQRALVLNFLAKEDKRFTTTEVAQGINYSTNGASRHLEDLVAHELVAANRKGVGRANQWELSDRTKLYALLMTPKNDNNLEKFMDVKIGDLTKSPEYRAYKFLLNLSPTIQQDYI